MRTLVVLLLVSSSLAGCADMIPDPPLENEPEWTTEYHNFTLENANNSTLPVIVFGDNTSMMQVFSADVIISNSTTNVTMVSKGYFLSDGMLFQSGYAPNVGNVTLHLTEMKGYEYNCSIVYRLWNLA